MLAIALLVLTQTFLLFTPFAQAQPSQTIYWAHYPFPPVYIGSGEQKGQGIADQVIKLQQREIPEFKHQNYNNSFTRIMRSFDEKRVICTGMNKTDERAKKVIYSRAAVLYPSHTLTYLKSRKRELEQSNHMSLDSEVSLEKLIQSESLDTLGITLNRSYNPHINQLLSENKDKVRTFEISTSMSSIFKQLSFQRISFTIEYPIVTFYWLQKLGLQGQINSVPLRDSSTGFVAYIACSRNAGGEKAIEAINDALARHIGRPRHRAIVERWLPGEMIAAYRKLYSEYFNAQKNSE